MNWAAITEVLEVAQELGDIISEHGEAFEYLGEDAIVEELRGIIQKLQMAIERK